MDIITKFNTNKQFLCYIIDDENIVDKLKINYPEYDNILSIDKQLLYLFKRILYDTYLQTTGDNLLFVDQNKLTITEYFSDSFKGIDISINNEYYVFIIINEVLIEKLQKYHIKYLSDNIYFLKSFKTNELCYDYLKINYNPELYIDYHLNKNIRFSNKKIQSLCNRMISYNLDEYYDLIIVFDNQKYNNLIINEMKKSSDKIDLYKQLLIYDIDTILYKNKKLIEIDKDKYNLTDNFYIINDIN